MVHTCNIIINEAEAGDCCKFEISLTYASSPKPIRIACIVRSCLNKMWKEGTGPVAQKIRACLRTWVWIPSSYEASSMTIHLCNTNIGGKDRQIPRACWLASPAERASLLVYERDCLRGIQWRVLEDTWPLFLACECPYTYVPASNTEGKGKRNEVSLFQFDMMLLCSYGFICRSPLFCFWGRVSCPVYLM